MQKFAVLKMKPEYIEWMKNNPDQGYWYKRMTILHSLLYSWRSKPDLSKEYKTKEERIKKGKSELNNKFNKPVSESIQQWMMMDDNELKTIYDYHCGKYYEAVDMWKNGWE